MGRGLQGRGIFRGIVRFTGSQLLSLIQVTAAWGQACDLYPIAISAEALDALSPGMVQSNVFRKVGPGQFGWLSWTGDPDVEPLTHSLTPPGDSRSYINPDDPEDRSIDPGDWIPGKPGLASAEAVRDALKVLSTREILVPTWDATRGQGDDFAYRVAGCARIRVLDYDLTDPGRLTVRFLAVAGCTCQNRAPMANAGPDLRVTVGQDVWLQGTVSDDGLPEGVPLEVEWSVVQGNGLMEFEDRDQPVTLARFYEVGTYVLRLTVDDSLTNGIDDLTVTVLPINQAPIVTAGPRQWVLYPEAALLRATVADDGQPESSALTWHWSEVDGPGLVSFSDPDATNTAAHFPDPGEYVVRFTAEDGALSASADVRIAVRTPAMNQPPMASAGGDVVVGLTHLAVLTGRIDDDGLPPGGPISGIWTAISGPGTVTFDHAAVTNEAPVTAASFSAPGTYGLRLTASDSELSHSDDVTVTVYPDNQPPLVEAGEDRQVVLPATEWLYPNSSAVTNVNVLARRSLFSVDRWNTDIGRPGITGAPWGGFLWVSRNGLAVDAGTLVVAGGFTDANGVHARSLARFDGSDWFNFYDTNALPYVGGPGHDGTDPGTTVAWLVYDCDGFPSCSETFDCAAVRGSEVFVGGLHKDLGNLDGLKDLTARWDGTRWRSWDFKRYGSDIADIETGREMVYVGGQFAFQPTNATAQTLTTLPWSYGIAAWDGSNWLTLGDGITDIGDAPHPSVPGLNIPHGRVNSIAAGSNGIVYAAGRFITATTHGFATNIAMWDGHTWKPLGSGLAGTRAGSWPVTSLVLADNGDLYAGGNFTNAGGMTVRHLARWDGIRWWPLGDGPANGVNGTVEAMAIHGRDLYAGGSFTEAGGLAASRLARWNGQFWSPLGSGSTNGVHGTGVFSLATDDTGLYVGGIFTGVGGLAANNLAQWEFAQAPVKEVRLHGLVTDDGLPTGALTHQWTQVSGPGVAGFADPHAAVTTATFSRPGTYVLRLTADDSDLTGFDLVTVTVRANQPPVVDAGPDQVIGLDEPLALNGFVSDDGLPANAPVHQVWHSLYGPGTVTFDRPADSNVTARFDRQGTYVLRLSANDSQFTTLDEVTVIVVPRNQPPAVSPGSSATLVLGDTYKPNAGVTDDGRPTNGALAVCWSVASAPGEVTFDDATLVQPTLRFSASGTHLLRLSATDSELTAAGQLTVRVNPPRNRPPTVQAGPDQTVTNLFTCLEGTVSDDGNPMTSALDVYWSPIGPSGTVTFANSNSPTTAVRFSQPGTHTLKLSANDGAYTVSDLVVITIPNQPPSILNAGPDRAITLPVASVTLEGVVRDRGNPGSPYWERLSGPGVASFSGATSLTPTITFSTPGTNVINLRVWDGGLPYDDQAVVVVAPAGNTAPAVNAGPDQTKSLSSDSLRLNGTVIDDDLPADGSLTTTWTQVVGPVPVTISDPSALDPTVTVPVAGTYLLRLTADDGALTNGDDVLITVDPPSNQPPVVMAGTDLAIRATDTIFLEGRVTDDALPDDGRLSAFWRKVSGPGVVHFASPASNNPPAQQFEVPTLAAFSGPGTYLLRLEADDSQYAASDDLSVTVLGADDNQAPIVDAGLDANTVVYRPFVLQGTVSDDGLPAGARPSSLWNVLSGPARVYFSDATGLAPCAQFSAPGIYILRLTATDTRLTTFDDVTITVSAPANQPPLVHAGLPFEITRPAPALLQGLVLDDALPVGYPLTSTWTKARGPGDVLFLPDEHQPLAMAFFSEAGQYTLRLAADDSEYTVMDEVNITVQPGTNSPPTVNAGPNLVVALGEPGRLTTEVSDDGLPQGVLEISWSRISGPAPVSFSTLNGEYHARFASEGDYRLRLTAHDGSFTNSDEVLVTVVDAGPPVAGILQPGDSTLLTAPTDIVGTASSPVLDDWTLEYRLMSDGSPSPSGGEGRGAQAPWTPLATASTSVVNHVLGRFDPTLLLNGIYELRLTVTDTVGRSASTDPLTVVVDRHLKIGHFRISFADLAVPVAGLPIRITRTYDSRAAAAGIQGDFGIGWTLDIRDVRLRKNRPLGRHWEQRSSGGLVPIYSLDPVRSRIVCITFPNGRQEKFALTPDPMVQPLIPITFPQWHFSPIDNTRGTLEPAGYDEPDGRFLIAEGAIPGTLNLYDLNFFSANPVSSQEELDAHPTLFRYTSAEGLRYWIDEREGLTRVQDPHGNTLVVDTNGVTWTNTFDATDGQHASLHVAFQRDPAGRITNILDAAGHSIRYAYSATGNLVGCVDRAGQTNGFVYDNADLPHHLTGILDARGVRSAVNVYDGNGRLVTTVDALGNSVHYGHDPARRQETVTNRLGAVTTYDYDAHGNVTRLIDPLGNETRFAYDTSGNLLTSVDPLGRTNRFTYDALDNLLTATDATDQTIRFTYGPLRRITSVTDPLGHSVSNTFDARGNLVSVRDPLGHLTRIRNNALGLPVAITNALGSVHQLAYDALGRLTGEINALGHAVHDQRDANGNLLARITTRTTPAGVETVSVAFEYDAEGRRTNSIFPDGSSMQTRYNAIGKPAAMVDPLGRVTSMTYDGLGRLLRTAYPDGISSSISYDAEGRVISFANRAGQVTQFDYDAGGRPVRTRFADGTAVLNGFDAAGQLATVTDSRGGRTQFGYDAAGRAIAVTNALGEVIRRSFDGAGNLTNRIDPLGRATGVDCDALNRPVRIRFADGTTRTAGYDPLGRLIRVEDQAGKATTFGYDALGRLRDVTNTLGAVTRYTRDELGQRTEQMDANGHVTRFEYDPMGRRTRRTLPGGQREDRVYNRAGLLTQHTDFNGYTTTYEHDIMNRLVAKHPDPRKAEPTVRFEYNALGWRTNMIDAVGSARYRYDVRNRLVETIRTWAAIGLSLALHYGYDANGNVTELVSSDPNGAAVAYEYDALNRLEAVEDPRLGRTEYRYDAAGNLAAWTSPNGIHHTRSHDALDRLTHVVSGDPLDPLAGFAYSLGPAGQRLTAAEQQPHTALQREYTYDDAYRLTRERISLPSQSVTVDYTYDPVGNRLARQSSIPQLPSATYGYDANDRFVHETCDANGNTLLGRVAPAEAPVQDAYDFEDRLLERHAAPDGQPVFIELGYDGDGRRILKRITLGTETRTTCYLIADGNPTGYDQVVEEHVASDPNAPTLSAVYTHGHVPLAQDRLMPDASGQASWAARFYGYDGHGNVRYLTDLNGVATDTYDYDAFGTLIGHAAASQPPSPNPHRFAGERFDVDLGLYHLRARDYNPDTGRFWTADRFEGFVSDPASLHRYIYCANNPVNCIDPSGNVTLTEMAHVGLIGGYTSAIVGSLSRGVGAASGGADLWGALDAANEGVAEDFAGGFVGGLFGYGAGKAAFWTVGKSAPFLLRWTPESLLAAFNRTAGRLQQNWLAAESAWARLQTSIVQGSQTATRSAQSALTQANTEIARISGDYNALATRVGYGPIANPLPRSGVFSRVMPREYAEAFARGDGTLAGSGEVFLGTAEDLAGITTRAGAQQRLGLFSDYEGHIPNLTGDTLVTFRLRDLQAIGLASPTQTVPQRGFGFTPGGLTKGKAREWLIRNGTSEELGAFDIQLTPLR